MKKVYSLFKNLIPLLIVIYLGAYLLVAIFFPAKSISVFGYSFAVVQTGSMEPKIKIKDIVCIVKTDKEDLEVGDIINFRTYVKLNTGEIRQINVVHYLGYISEDASFFKTQSYGRREEGSFDAWYDENGNRTDALSSENLIGKVAFRIPYLGYLTEIFHEPILLMLLSINGLLIILLVVVIKDKNRKKENEERIEN